MKYGLKISTMLMIIGILFLISPVSAELICGLDIMIYENTSIKINDIEVKPGEVWGSPEVDFGTQDFYIVQLLDENYSTAYEYYIPIDEEFEETRMYLTLPYNPSSHYLDIFYNGYEDLRLSVNLNENLCNNDGFCDIYETYWSCPSDCPKCSEDRICDEDCLKGEDPDCEDEEIMEMEITNYFIPVLVIIAIILIVIGLFFFKRRGTGI